MKIRALVAALVLAAVTAACSSTVTAPSVEQSPRSNTQQQDTVPRVDGGHTMGSGG